MPVPPIPKKLVPISGVARKRAGMTGNVAVASSDITKRSAAMRKELLVLGLKIKKQLTMDTPWVTGTLAGSTAAKVKRSGVAGGWWLRVSQSARPPKPVGRAVAYQIMVLKGSQPHRPPFENLLEWVGIRWGVAGSQQREAARTLADSIAFRGTKANPYILHTVQRSRRWVREAAKRIGQDIAIGAVREIRFG